MDFSLLYAGFAAAAIILALVVVALAVQVHRQKHQLAKQAAASAAGREIQPAAIATTAWGRFWDRWEWKPMRLPLLIVVVLAVHLLANFQNGFFAVFTALITKLHVQAQWWDVGLLFGFFGAAVAVFAGGIMAIIALGSNLSTDSPPPTEGQVSDSTVKEILSANAARDEKLERLATSISELAAATANRTA